MNNKNALILDVRTIEEFRGGHIPKAKNIPVQELKSQCKCAKCGDDRGYVLEYHHINPEEKENTIARLTSNNYTLDKVYDEIQKCIVLCANCHREFHYLNSKDNNFTLEKYLK